MLMMFVWGYLVGVFSGPLMMWAGKRIAQWLEGRRDKADYIDPSRRW